MITGQMTKHRFTGSDFNPKKNENVIKQHPHFLQLT